MTRSGKGRGADRVTSAECPGAITADRMSRLSRTVAGPRIGACRKRGPGRSRPTSPSRSSAPRTAPTRSPRSWKSISRSGSGRCGSCIHANRKSTSTHRRPRFTCLRPATSLTAAMFCPASGSRCESCSSKLVSQLERAARGETPEHSSHPCYAPRSSISFSSGQPQSRLAGL
jgi:hypothetical protein